MSSSTTNLDHEVVAKVRTLLEVLVSCPAMAAVRPATGTPSVSVTDTTRGSPRLLPGREINVARTLGASRCRRTERLHHQPRHDRLPRHQPRPDSAPLSGKGEQCTVRTRTTLAPTVAARHGGWRSSPRVKLYFRGHQCRVARSGATGQGPASCVRRRRRWRWGPRSRFQTRQPAEWEQGPFRVRPDTRHREPRALSSRAGHVARSPRQNM